MTKRKVGRPIIYTDPYHAKWRHDQTSYNRELVAICKEFPNLTLKQARVIRRKRKAQRVQRKAEQELKEFKEE